MVDSHKQTDRLVKAEFGLLVENCVLENTHQTPKEPKHHDKEVVCLEDMGGPEII